MAGIYERDQLNLQAALADALNRREKYRERQNERVKNSIGEFGKIAETLGRTAEVGFTPDDEDNPEYRSARERYIMTGDRSGLYQYEAAKRAKAEAEANRAFQASEAEKNRAFQASEGAANRAIQREQNAHSKIMDKAKLLRDYNNYNAIIDDIDANRGAYGAKWQIERAKAVNDRDMQKQLMKSSGLFTPEELGEAPKAPVAVPFKPGYVAEQPTTTAQAQETSEETKTYADWMKHEPLIKQAVKEGRWNDAEKLIGELNPDDLSLQKPVGEYRTAIASGRKQAAFVNARFNAAKNYKFNVYDIRKALDMGKAGGGKDSGEISFPWDNGGKTTNVPLKIKRRGNVADLITPDGKVAQKGIPLF